MASYTIELQFLLRGFSEANQKPGLYVSPRSMIEMSYKNFFKAVGDYSFKIWNDERDKPFQEQFEKDFLEYFYVKEINFFTPDAFLLKLGSFLRRKIPLYCQHWKMILEEMYITQTGNMQGISQGRSTNNDSRQTDSWGKSNTKNQTKTISDTDTTNKSAKTDTPQGYLEMDLEELDYATEVGKSETNTKNSVESESNTDTVGEDHSKTTGNAAGNTETNNVTDNYGRNKDVFEIYDQWLISGYDLFTPVFKEMMHEQIFLLFN